MSIAAADRGRTSTKRQIVRNLVLVIIRMPLNSRLQARRQVFRTDPSLRQPRAVESRFHSPRLRSRSCRRSISKPDMLHQRRSQMSDPCVSRNRSAWQQITPPQVETRFHLRSGKMSRGNLPARRSVGDNRIVNVPQTISTLSSTLSSVYVGTPRRRRYIARYWLPFYV